MKLGHCTLSYDRMRQAWRVWLDDIFCPRLSLENAMALAKRINTLYDLRGREQARIRLASYCITCGVNE